MAASASKESPRKSVAKSGFLALLWSMPVFILFIYLGKTDMGFGAWICSGVVLLTIRGHWVLRKHLWFWLTIIFTMLLQIPFVLLFPWGDRNLTGISLLPIAGLDYGIVYGCIKLVEIVMKRSGGANAPN